MRFRLWLAGIGAGLLLRAAGWASLVLCRVEHADGDSVERDAAVRRIRRNVFDADHQWT